MTNGEGLASPRRRAGHQPLFAANLLHHLKFAKPAPCTFIQSAALVVQNVHNIDAAQLVDGRAVGKTLLEFQTGAALRQGVPVGLAACHAKIDIAAIDDVR